MPAGGLEVAVIPDHPGLPQAAELRLRQQPVGGAGGRAPLVPYPAVRPAQGFRLPVGQRPAGRDHRKAPHSLGPVRRRAARQIVGLQQRIGLRIHGIMGRLGAEFAVFRAPAAFPVDDGTQLEPVPAEMRADLVRRRAQRRQRRGFRQGERLLPGKLLSGQHPVLQLLYHTSRSLTRTARSRPASADAAKHSTASPGISSGKADKTTTSRGVGCPKY